jgi:6-phosphogluconolactonase
MSRVGAGEVRVLADPAEVAATAADEIVAAAEAAMAARGRFTVALAGGSTPKATYSFLAAEPRRDRIDWARVEVFFGDERCVPPEHPDSNYRMANEALLSKVPVASDHVHRIRGEVAAEDAAVEYEALLRARLGAGPWPPFDLVLLGMGPDGHTASLFPGTTALAETSHLAIALFVPHLGAHRVTLTAPELSAARRVIVTAVGAEKAAALAAALDGPSGSVPIQLVRPPTGALTWLVDRAAAARLAP